MSVTCESGTVRRPPCWVHALAFLLLACGLTEGLLRVYGLDRPILYEADSAAGFRIKPDQQVSLLAGTVHINAWGLRDARPFNSPDFDSQRILILGDSVTWGGLRTQTRDLFPARLEARLLSTQVMNGGINGASVVQMWARYSAHWKDLAPDRVIVYAVPGSFERPPRVHLREHSLAFPQRKPRFAIPVALELARFELSRNPFMRWLSPPAPAESAYPDLDLTQRRAMALDAMTEAGKALGAGLLIVLAPTDARVGDQDARERVRKGLLERGLPVVDLAEIISDEENLYTDGVHYTRNGHAGIAEILERVLHDHGWTNGRSLRAGLSESL